VRGLANQKLDFKPGTKFNYSNAAFDVLAVVISQASGMSFEEYMKSKLFNPVGMKNSTFSKPEVPENLATAPHVINDRLETKVSQVYPYNRIHAPSSTLHSNVVDMLLWAKMYLNEGSINGKKIINSESYQLLLTPNYETPGGGNVCLSWFAGNREGQPIYSHSGGDLGYRTFFAILPESGASVVVMGNNPLIDPGALAMAILDCALFDKPAVMMKKPAILELKSYFFDKGPAEFNKEYLRLRSDNPEKYDFRSKHLDLFGHWLLDRSKFAEAVEIFQLNVELEPEYAGWYDSVGDAYRGWGKKEQAILWYKKALEIDPDLDMSIRKLKDLQEE